MKSLTNKEIPSHRRKPLTIEGNAHYMMPHSRHGQHETHKQQSLNIRNASKDTKHERLS